MKKEVSSRSEDKKTFTLSGLLILSFSFLTTIFLGILISQRLYRLFLIQEEKIVPVSFWQFLFQSLIGLFLIFAIFLFGQKFKGGKRFLLKGLFLVSTGLGSLIVLEVLIGDIAFFLVLILIFLWLKKPCVFFQDLLIILGIAGAGSFLGIRLNSETVILLLVLFSVYDYLAVFKTRHMVKMTREMINQGAILGLVLPQRFIDLKASLKEVKPGKRFFILGGGDIAFPLLLCSSLVTEDSWQAIIVGLFSLIGLWISFVVFFKQSAGSRRAIPALPPIALFSLIGFLIVLLI